MRHLVENFGPFGIMAEENSAISLKLGHSACVVLLAIAAHACAADLILTNGKIVTLDPARPQAEAIAITSGKITALGTTRQIAAQAGPGAKVIDLGGRLAIPGFIEGHGHFLGL